MNELIKLQPQTINGTTIETVSARELHAFIESKQQFATWIKNRISEYDFAENQDFVCVSQKNETQRADGQIGVSVSNEYYITLDMAKELSMVERNDKGKQARKYFIECEKQLHTQQPQLPTDPFLLIAHFAKQAYLMQQKQSEMDNRLIKIEQKQQQLNQDNDHFTIKGFCSLHGIDLSNGKMSALSKKAKKLSDVKDYTYHEITDPRWGKVRTYHKDILTELFEFEQLL